MKKYTLWIAVIMIALVHNGYSQNKLAQTGFQFLSVGTDARAAAMGDAFTTVEGVSSALFHNPAGMANSNFLVDLSVSHNKWIADINHSAVSMAYNPANGKYGVFGLSLMWVDYGEFLGTMVWRNGDEYVDTGEFSPSAIAFALGYAKTLTDRFAVGGQVRRVAQSLGNSVIVDKESSTGFSTKSNVLSTLAFDFGTIFHTGVKSLAFGMSVRNFSKEVKFQDEGFQLPLTFKMGVSMNVMDFMEGISPDDQSLNIVIDAVHPRSYSEYVNIGGEYAFRNMFILRGGYVSNHDEYGLSYGFGVQKFGLAIDYAYTPFGVFDNVQRITARFSY
ncbi:PorV/PorQ family protein [candidate division KSB1 bacterium]|nr:PorV/PorQ family protein [candidate division KSB1 bacterium]